MDNTALASVSEMSFVALTVLSACNLMHFIPVSLASEIMLPSSSLGRLLEQPIRLSFVGFKICLGFLAAR